MPVLLLWNLIKTDKADATLLTNFNYTQTDHTMTMKVQTNGKKVYDEISTRRQQRVEKSESIWIIVVLLLLCADATEIIQPVKRCESIH